MWIVKNLLRGTLTFRGLAISIPPKGDYDLDLLGRKRAEESNQVLVAFEEGYLQTVFKDQSGLPGAQGISSLTDEQLVDRLESFKRSVLAEIRAAIPGQPAAAPGPAAATAAGVDELKAAIADVKDALKNLKVVKLKLREEKERVVLDATLSEAEIRARLAFLEEKERELEKNFAEIGRKSGRKDVAQGASVVEKADLLSSI